jgi:hypothetical protein
VADAQFKADVGLRRVFEPWIFDLTGDLICGRKKGSVSDKCFGAASSLDDVRAARIGSGTVGRSSAGFLGWGTWKSVLSELVLIAFLSILHRGEQHTVGASEP